MSIDWREVRARFPIAERSIYLNTGWAGPSSTATISAMQDRAAREAFEGPTAPDIRNEKGRLVAAVKHQVAALIGAADDEVALMYTTTEGINTVLRGMGLQRGDSVLVCNLEHNAIMVPAYVARDRDGLDVEIVRLRMDEDGAGIIDAFDHAITPATKLLMLSHISWNRGTRLPMRKICEIAHTRGALVAVDAAQSAGQIDFDVREMACDFLALPGHKWLLGPAGAAFLYVRRELIERLQPLAVVHGANRRYDFEGHFEYANDTVKKFELTTHSGPVLAGLGVAMDRLAEIGMPAIEQRCLGLATRFIQGIRGVGGVRITTPLDVSVRSGIVTFEVEGQNPSEVCGGLWVLDRIVARVCNDRRVRACFHVFNDESDVDRTIAAVASIAGQGLPTGTHSEAEYKAYLIEADD